MKLLIASDIHGSALFCKKLIDNYREEKAERLILLGDILYHGPRNDLPEGYAPKSVIELLNPLKDELLCVRGNCEAEVDQMVIAFPVLADYAVIFDGKTQLFLTHGHVLNEKTPPPLKKGSVLLNGHTHIPAARRHEDYIYVNPGSVSIPKENSERSYIIYENGEFIWKRLDDKSEYMRVNI